MENLTLQQLIKQTKEALIEAGASNYERLQIKKKIIEKQQGREHSWCPEENSSMCIE